MKPGKLKRYLPNGRQAVIGVPFVWLFLFFLLPFFIVLKISFAEADVAIPPYTDIYSWADNQLQIVLNLGNYIFLTEDELYLSAYLGSLTQHVFESIAQHGHFGLHVRVLAGRDPHHIVEAQFKAFARALREAVEPDGRTTAVPSTKGVL